MLMFKYFKKKDRSLLPNPNGSLLEHLSQRAKEEWISFRVY